MAKKPASPRSRSVILPLENRCLRIRSKIKALQKAMKQIEKKSDRNFAWRGLLNSSVSGMNEALGDLEKRLDHIKQEVKEFL